jgi:NADH dehydrogenase
MDRRIEFAAASVLEPESLIAAFQGCDAVIHLVGIIAEIGNQTFEAIHTRGTANALAAAKATGIRRFVQMSALGSRPNAVSRYHQSKWAAEELVRQSGLEWTIFRPSLIYGPGDGFLNLFARIARFSPIVPIMGPGDALLQPIHVEDVARCFTGALGNRSSIETTFDVCGPDRYCLREVVGMVLQATGRHRWKLSIPWPAARILAHFLETVYPTFLHLPAPLNRDQLKMLAEDNVGDPFPAMRAFGFQPTRLTVKTIQFLR